MILVYLQLGLFIVLLFGNFCYLHRILKLDQRQFHLKMFLMMQTAYTLYIFAFIFELVNAYSQPD